METSQTTKQKYVQHVPVEVVGDFEVVDDVKVIFEVVEGFNAVTEVVGGVKVVVEVLAGVDICSGPITYKKCLLNKNLMTLTVKHLCNLIY